MSQLRSRNQRGSGDRLREDLLKATRKLADKLGSTEKLSMRAIAREAGVAAPSVYLHFESRDDIFRAAVAEDYAALAGDLRAAAAQASSPLERLKALGRAYCGFAVKYPGRYRLITEVQQAKPKGRADNRGHPAGEVQSILLDAVRDCQRAYPGSDRDSDLILSCIWSAWHGFVELRRSKPMREWPPAGDVITLIANAIFHGNERPPVSRGRRTNFRQRVVASPG